jgi:AcrR family transcriptional regulator
VAAALFGEHGYDAVSIVDVARAADVSDQTVYNYFPAKQDLVLDRADEILDWYRQVILERPKGTSPASALRPPWKRTSIGTVTPTRSLRGASSLRSASQVPSFADSRSR